MTNHNPPFASFWSRLPKNKKHGGTKAAHLIATATTPYSGMVAHNKTIKQLPQTKETWHNIKEPDTQVGHENDAQTEPIVVKNVLGHLERF